MSDMANMPIAPAFAARTVSWWSWLHGAVALELNGQFHWLDEHGATELFEVTLAAALSGVHD